ncbi:MAG: hypothetical protein RIB97_13100 [Nitratireductor sp.]
MDKKGHLETECERLLKAAHEAPMNPLRTDANGHRWVALHSSAWARRSSEYMAARARLDAISKSTGGK